MSSRVANRLKPRATLAESPARPAAVAWAIYTLAGIVIGMLRELTLRPALSIAQSQIVGGVLHAAVIFAAALFLLRRRPGLGHEQLRRVGMAWAIATLVFEITMAHWIGDLPWSDIAGNFNLLAGRTFPLVLLFSAFAPSLAGRWKLRRSAEPAVSLP